MIFKINNILINLPYIYLLKNNKILKTKLLQI